jgi:hypothetical protein
LKKLSAPKREPGPRPERVKKLEEIEAELSVILERANIVSPFGAPAFRP